MSLYTWLQWPVQIKDYIGDKHTLHITARFMGKENISVPAVENLIRGRGYGFDFKPDQFSWMPDRWGGHFVLHLLNVPHVMIAINKATEPLYPNQYSPWKPHITVSTEYWNRAVVEEIKAFDVLDVAPYLELIVQGSKHYRWTTKELGL